MPSLIPGYEHDIFISYRQKDNKYDAWVSEFVKNLKSELDATLKENVSIYFDENPFDGILASHQVNETIFLKIKSLIFLPILSQTYCDPNCFAWRNEFQPFLRMASVDKFGRDVKLRNGNMASRILCVKIHELEPDDIRLLEEELGGTLRSIDFIYKSAGVNRPLRFNEDNLKSNLNHVSYRDQINKVANAIKELILKMNGTESYPVERKRPVPAGVPIKSKAEKSIAVLPFLNLSMDPAQEYFADGITENILTQLAGIDNLKVISRTSIMRYKNTLKSIGEIAQELGVNYILEGSAQSYGEKVRINAQLIEAQEDKHLWAKAFDKELKDIFEIQSYVANEVVEHLKISLKPMDKERLAFIPTTNLEAYDLYLKGRHSLNLYTLEGFRLSEKYFKLSLQEDSNFILAYSGLARTYIHLVSWMGDLSPEEGLKESERYLKMVSASELTPTDYQTKGWIDFFIRKDFSAAEINLRRSVEESGYKDAGLLYAFSYLLNMLQRTDEAMDLVIKARRIDPVSVPAFNYTGVTYYILGQYESALGTFSESIKMHPLAVREHDHLAKVFMVMGRYHEVVQTIHAGLLHSSTRPPSMLIYLSVALMKLGQKEKAKKLLQEIIERSLYREKGINVYLAQYYAIMDDKEEAFHWLERAIETNDTDLFWLKADPLFKNLQTDKRYQLYLTKVGFVENSGS